MGRLRVLHVLPDTGPGGAQRMAVHLANTLDRARFEVSAISLLDPVGTDLEELLAQAGVPMIYLGKRIGFDPRTCLKIDRVVRSFHPHVVHTHLHVLGYVLPSVLLRRVPVVHTVHNVAEKEIHRVGRRVHALAFRFDVVPVAIAEEVRGSLVREYHIGECPLIPNAVPVEEYRHTRLTREAWRAREGFAPEDVLFVCVGGLRLQKNHALLLQAFGLGPTSNPQAHLVLVGEGQLRGALEEQVEALGLKDNVHFLGLRTDIPDILGAADIFVLSSDWEGNPLSVMEAMAARKPVIGTAVGGVPELVDDGRSGLLVPQGRAEALSEAMCKLLTDVELRTSMGECATHQAEQRFDVQVMTRAYEELYWQVVGTKVAHRKEPA